MKSDPIPTLGTRNASRTWLIDAFHAVLFGILLFVGLRLQFSEPADWQFILVIWLGIACYLAILVGASRSNMVCVWLSVLPPASIFLCTAPNVIYNLWAFANDHPTYQDSPGTILVVTIMAVFLTLPSAITLGAYWRQRRQLFVRATR